MSTKKKKCATRDDSGVPLDVRREIEAMYEAMGGRPGLIEYGKNHETWAYNKFVETMTTQIAAQVDTHVTVHDGEAAKQKLQDAFMRLIEASGKEHGTVIHGDEVVYRDPARITDAARDAASYTRIHDEPRRADGPATAGTGHAARDDTPLTRDERPSPEQNQNISNRKSEGSYPRGGPRSDVSTYAQPVSNAPTTTELYYEYMNSGGGHRTRWDNNQ